MAARLPPRASLGEHARLRPAELIDALYRDVVRFADDARQHDDLTALVVRRSARATR